MATALTPSSDAEAWLPSTAAIELVGAASAMREAIQLPTLPAERAGIEETLATARAAIAPDVADRAFTRGRRLTPDATVARALASLSVRI